MLYKGLEHPPIVVSMGGPGTSPQRYWGTTVFPFYSAGLDSWTVDLKSLEGKLTHHQLS